MGASHSPGAASKLNIARHTGVQNCLKQFGKYLFPPVVGLETVSVCAPYHTKNLSVLTPDRERWERLLMLRIRILVPHADDYAHELANVPFEASTDANFPRNLRLKCFHVNMLSSLNRYYRAPLSFVDNATNFDGVSSLTGTRRCNKSQ